MHLKWNKWSHYAILVYSVCTCINMGLFPSAVDRNAFMYLLPWKSNIIVLAQINVCKRQNVILMWSFKFETGLCSYGIHKLPLLQWMFEYHKSGNVEIMISAVWLRSVSSIKHADYRAATLVYLCPGEASPRHINKQKNYIAALKFEACMSI